MRLCVAQTRPLKGDIEKNIESHKKIIELASRIQADLVFFPELSLTGYEPKMARKLASFENDNRYNIFQTLSEANNIIICIGTPLKSDFGIFISMLIYEPTKLVQIYSKQFLHDDELPYFIAGKKQVYLHASPDKLAPAICYELSVPEHSANAFRNGANIYVASVAKTKDGVEKAKKILSEIAKKYAMIVVMSNCVGVCDDFECGGASAVWNMHGELIEQLDDKNEGILIFDTETTEVITIYI